MKRLLLFFVACLAVAASAATTEAKRDPYAVSPLSYRNRIFFGKSSSERAALIDRVSFVQTIDAFQPSDKSLPLNETYLACAATNANKTLLAPCAGGNVSSRRQIRTAREKGYRVCLGPIATLDDIVPALMAEPDVILLTNTLEVATLKEKLLAAYPGLKNPNTPINLAETDGFVLNYDRAAHRAGGTRWRVLSFNILAELWNHKPAIAARADCVAEVIQHVKPDLIGLQEAQKEWYFALKDKVSPYRFVTHPAGTVPAGDPSCQLLFNAEKYRLIASGLYPFTDRWIRCLHWSVLEDQKTDERVIFTNTHWDLTEDRRLKNAKRMSTFIKELQTTYHAPVVCTGDFNTSITRPDLQYFLTQSGFRDAVETANATENRGISSWYWPVTSDTPYRGVPHIDHVITSPDMKALVAFLVLDPKVLAASDHLPLVVDLARTAE